MEGRPPGLPAGPSSGADVDPGRLELGVFVERVNRLVAPEAGLLEAAEGRGDMAVVEAVDPDDAGAQGLGGLERLGDVAGPDRGGEAIDRIVPDPHRLLRRLEGDGRED